MELSEQTISTIFVALLVGRTLQEVAAQINAGKTAIVSLPFKMYSKHFPQVALNLRLEIWPYLINAILICLITFNLSTPSHVRLPTLKTIKLNDNVC